MYGATVGRIGVLGIPATVNQACFVIHPNVYISLKFLYFWFQGFRDELIKLATGAGQPNVSGVKILSLILAAPLNFKEQTAIANFLDRETLRIDALVEEKKRFIELLKEKRQSLISHAVTKGLDPAVKMKDSGVEWLGEVPKHWLMSYLKFVTHKIIDTEHKTAPFYENGEYHVVRTSDVKNGKLIYASAKYTNHEVYLEWTARGRPEAGDILFTREAPAGEACVVPANSHICLGQRMVLFKVNHKKYWHPSFLSLHFLQLQLL